MITADDFGLNSRTNKEIVNLFLKKKIHRASLLTNLPHSKEAAILAKKYNVPTGLHFNLIEGKPSSLKSKVKSLTNSKGFFYPTPIFLLRLLFNKIKDKEIKKEFLSQINFLRKHNLEPEFVNSHQNIHLFPPVYKVIKTCEPLLPLRPFQVITKRFLKFPFKLVFIKFISKLVNLYSENNEKGEIIIHPGTDYDFSFLEKILGLTTIKK